MPDPKSRQHVVVNGRDASLPPAYREWRDLALRFYRAEVPAGYRVSGPLRFAKLRIRSLPAGLSVDGDLDLRQCQRMRQIGDGLSVKGDLTIGGRCSDELQWERELGGDESLSRENASFKKLSRNHQCPIERLPEGLTVDGDFGLRSCPGLAFLPARHRFGGSVLIESCHTLCRLPDRFAVAGDLTLKGCRSLRRLPDNLRVAGDLRLIGVPIRRLPESLEVGGSLILEDCPGLIGLPAGLTTTHDLVVRRCPITTLPEGLNVGRNLLVDQCEQIEAIPADLRVGQDIRLHRCANICRFPQHVKVHGSLHITRCPRFHDLPEGLVVPDVLNLAGCSAMEKLPNGLRVGHKRKQRQFDPALILSDCLHLKSIPGDLRVNGPIDVAGSGLTGLPERLENQIRLFWRGMAVQPAVVFHPETLQPADILGERNAELRRIMLDRVGLETVLSKANAKVLHEDTDPGGRRRLLEVKVGFRQHRYLDCRCPSTSRRYLLRVPPRIANCPAAAAWLAGFDNPDEYQPVQET